MEFFKVGLIKVIVSLVFLLSASYFDYKEREVPDTVWALFIPIAASLTIYELYLSGFAWPLLTKVLLSIVLSTALFLVVSYVGLYGGADAKALISLSVLMPVLPEGFKPVLGCLAPFLPISFFNNSVILSLIAIPYVIALNLLWKIRRKSPLFKGFEAESILKKIAALAFCVKVDKSRVKPYDSIAEDVVVTPEGKILRKLRLSWKAEEERDVDYKALPQEVFVSFSIPMIVFITLGFLVTLFLGDLVIWIVESFFQLLLAT